MEVRFPLISIVVSTYNGEAFLQAQIQSLLHQTYKNIEIIISDDASVDNTVNILSPYEKDPRVHIICNKKNAGVVKNFEIAIEHAKGEYIAFCDQDDIWLPVKIEKLYDAIGDYSLVYSDSKLINQHGEYLGKNLSDFRRMYTGNDTRAFTFSNVVSGHTMLVRKDLVLHSLPFPDNIHHDHWLAVKATLINGIVYVDEPLTLYRQHDNNVTSIQMDKNPLSRSVDKRYEDFMHELEWIKLLARIQKGKHKFFFEKLAHLFLLKAHGRFVWPLFVFLLKHQQYIFQLTKKNYISKLIEIRKMARGEGRMS